MNWFSAIFGGNTLNIAIPCVNKPDISGLSYLYLSVYPQSRIFGGQALPSSSMRLRSHNSKAKITLHFIICTRWIRNSYQWTG